MMEMRDWNRVFLRVVPRERQYANLLSVLDVLLQTSYIIQSTELNIEMKTCIFTYLTDVQTTGDNLFLFFFVL